MEYTLASIVASTGTVVTAFVGWFLEILEAVVTNPIGQLVLALGLIGFTSSAVYKLVAKIKGGKKRGRR